jgi:hypothetical protein
METFNTRSVGDLLASNEYPHGARLEIIIHFSDGGTIVQPFHARVLSDSGVGIKEQFGHRTCVSSSDAMAMARSALFSSHEWLRGDWIKFWSVQCSRERGILVTECP